MDDKKRYKPKKATFKRLLVAFILIIAVVGGVYALLNKNDDKAVDKPNIKVQKEEKPKDKVKDTQKTEEDSKETGKVTNEKPTISNEQGETTNKEETNVNMPTYDKDAIIANAKSQVYTVYTDLQQGSGFLVNQKGDILTNAHVAKDAGYVVVKNQHGQEFQGKVIGISKKTDVALIRVPDLAGKNPLVLDAATAKVGTKVVAIGSPKDHYGTTTEGIVKSIGAEFIDDYTYDHLYEITARLNRGSSGGPLINAETGNVIGINSIILEDQPEIGYAIPISAVTTLINNWSAKNPVIKFDNGEPDNNHANEAFFSNELLKDNMIGYYTLVEQTLKEKDDFYSTFILPNSPAIATAKKMIGNYSSTTRKFVSIKYNVKGITIGKDSSTVNVQTVTTYTDVATKKKNTITENVTYTIIIDEFGQYMIKSIVINSAVDTGDKQVTEKPAEETPEKEDPANTTGENNKNTEPDVEGKATAETSGDVKEAPKNNNQQKVENDKQENE